MCVCVTLVVPIEAGSLLETHYNELLKTIEEIGRDVKPSYTSNKVSTDRLKKSEPLSLATTSDCQYLCVQT